MKCPKCGNEMIFEWRELWFDHKDDAFTDIVYHCDNCDYDMKQVKDKEGKEVGRKQFFFG